VNSGQNKLAKKHLLLWRQQGLALHCRFGSSGTRLLLRLAVTALYCY